MLKNSEIPTETMKRAAKEIYIRKSIRRPLVKSEVFHINHFI